MRTGSNEVPPLSGSDIDPRALVTGNPWAIAHAIIGDTWTQLILREAFFGVRRFSDWSRSLGIPRSVLSDRLQRLCDAGVMEQRLPPGSKRFEYRLTEMGRDLYGVAILQSIWERDHAPPAFQRRYYLTYFDVETGDLILPGILDGSGGDPIDPRDIEVIEGPGLVARAPPSKRRLSSMRSTTGVPIIDRSVHIIGDYWTWAAIGAILLGFRRFDQIGDATGMAPNVLSDRLTRLQESGVVERTKSANDRHHQYRLTGAGRDLLPFVLAIYAWAVRWLFPAGQSPLRLVRRSTGKPINPAVCDTVTGIPLRANRVRWRLEAPTTFAGRDVRAHAQ